MRFEGEPHRWGWLHNPCIIQKSYWEARND